ncbi:hypothetical protein [Sediminibacillus halophilus]|uniref:Uncharacterized protein n=1 Tax=Sediminibacillus halophilus TaxID=482461 RepID=A0A1G9QTG8_9BACI|nr:hypothetical protein [Sediminibacillus halophilus]SDM14318.1 hypothetical protein SAMN05216244_1657 [Sediminibacillus halophilus]
MYIQILLLGLAGFLVSLAFTVIFFINKKKKTIPLVSLVASILIFMLGYTMIPTGSEAGQYTKDDFTKIEKDAKVSVSGEVTEIIEDKDSFLFILENEEGSYTIMNSSGDKVEKGNKLTAYGLFDGIQDNSVFIQAVQLDKD